MNEQLKQKLSLAKQASLKMLLVDKQTKCLALERMSQALYLHQERILEENHKDILLAKEKGIEESKIDRLLLNVGRIDQMAKELLKIRDLEDPIGKVIREMNRPNGLKIQQVRVPLGVIGIIYEARPNVTVDVASLCIKSSNVCVLKGGSLALNSNRILSTVLNEAVKDLLPEGVITFIDNEDRHIVDEMIHAREYIDVLVPRGGKGLIDFVTSHASIPVIETGAGVCHLYVDAHADLEMALKIADNAKNQRPSVCNAIETLLVHEDVANDFLPKLKQCFDTYPTLIKGDSKVCEILSCLEANEEDWSKEYNDYILSIKVVKDIHEAIQHIQMYSTKHSETIVTEKEDNALLFMNSIDSACLYWNASTRFSDGGEFGFGAELGISTQKLHARGPLGLEEMTSTKYMIYGKGQIR